MQRCIDIEGAPNFRDLGGYPAADGRRVKWRTFFRSDDLNDLNDAGVGILGKFRIKCVVDFRTAHEFESWPDRIPAAARSVNIPVDAGRVMGRFHKRDLTPRKTAGIMISVYRDLAGEQRDAFRRFFEIIADPDNTPLLFHCTAGKDRTGFAAALLLYALGADDETVMRDYVLSAECLKKRYTAGVDYTDVTAPLYTVHSEFLSAALEVVVHRFGGPEKYLTEQLGVDIGALRELYTEEGTVFS